MSFEDNFLPMNQNITAKKRGNYFGVPKQLNRHSTGHVKVDKHKTLSTVFSQSTSSADRTTQHSRTGDRMIHAKNRTTMRKMGPLENHQDVEKENVVSRHTRTSLSDV